jgi:hypothetical protein
MNENQQPLGSCARCGHTLRVIGTARKGGKKHQDWATRTLHKKCWKEEKEEQDRIEHISGVIDRLQNEPLGIGWSIGY